MKLGLHQELVLGPPGTGKTTTLLNELEAAMDSGMQPEDIMFVSFTRKAVREAITRACDRFKMKPSRFPLFQTVHAFCFRQLGCTKQSLMNSANYAELGEWLGYTFTSKVDMDEGTIAYGGAPGDQILQLDSLARTRNISVRECWEDVGGLDGVIPWIEQERLSAAYARFKEQRGLMDFTDMLLQYPKTGRPVKAQLAMIDEAQDLSLAQWGVLKHALQDVSRVIVAGDDDQAIFQWGGADLTTFLALEGDKRVLSQSYRLPKLIHSKSMDILRGVKHRYKKQFAPTDMKGEIQYVSHLDQVEVDPEETTLVLVRNVIYLNQVYDFIKSQSMIYTGRKDLRSVKSDHIVAIRAWEKMRRGDVVSVDEARIFYSYLRVGEYLAQGGKLAINAVTDGSELLTFETLQENYGLKKLAPWHDALIGIPLETREHYLTVLREGRKITAPPVIHANTIHGVKGGEADHVIILSDMTRRTYRDMLRDPDAEARVAYVAVTRAKKRLTIVLPNTIYSYRY